MFHTDYQKSLFLLNAGDLKGFEYYKARWFLPNAAQHRQKLQSFGVPYLEEWDQCTGKRILVSGEQGLGDQILFSRVLPLIRKNAKRVTLISSHELCDWFARNLEDIEIMPMGYPITPSDVQAGYDAVSASGDLFSAYINRFHKIAPVPHFSSIQTPVKGESTATSQRKKIGLFYKTTVISDTGAARSLSPEMFRFLAEYFDVCSFQVPFEFLDFASANVGHIVRTFGETSNHAATMDAIVTCDTAFAHLCLNMGLKTVLVHGEFLDWRWKIPLYPSVKLVKTGQDFEAQLLKAMRSLFS